MYERFTDRARKVFQLANQEAQRLNHCYVGVEHVLLGLVKEGSGVAANVLKNLDIDLREIRLEVEKRISLGPESFTLGRLPQTVQAKKVTEHAIEEARSLNHGHIGTEHLLVGLIRAGGIASEVLEFLGATLDRYRESLKFFLRLELDKVLKLSDEDSKLAEQKIEEVLTFRARSMITVPTQVEITPASVLTVQALLQDEIHQAVQSGDGKLAVSLYRVLEKLGAV